ncbi:MAG: alpha/beta hydrolase [Clostridia bacterium]|nr:alpha/beta hydrolase [Clostridia bacterium]
MRSKKDVAVLKALEWGQNLGEYGLWFLFYESSKGIVVEKDISYGDHRRNRFNIAYKKGKKSKKKPVFVYFHGGGYTSGMKCSRQFYCNNWVNEGFAAVNVNYHYGENYPFKKQLYDCFKAVERLYDLKDEFNLDMDRIVLAGESAGAHIAAFLAAAWGNRDVYENFAPDFKYKDEFKAKACVFLSGIFDTERLLSLKFPNMQNFCMCISDGGYKEVPDFLKSAEGRKYAPLNYVTEYFPKSVIISSSADRLKPNGQWLSEKLNENGVSNMTYTCSGLSCVHGGALFTKAGSGKDCLLKTKKFIRDNV